MTNTWEPQEIDGLTLAFPTDVSHLMPAYADIPDEFKRPSGNKWVELSDRWFFRGIGDVRLFAKDGIDPEKAIRHLAAIQGSWEPKHEHKSAGVAYLMSLWFTDWKDER